jgi:hypothetical protein
MTDELSDKVKSQIEEILSKFPKQGGLDLTKLKEKAMTRLLERLPYVLVPLAIELIFAQGEDIGERIAERFRYVLTALVVEVILITIHEELDKLGRSKPCKHLTPEYAPLCVKGKEWGPACLNCEDYEPMEEW